jgi:hypothetical protein
MPVLWFEGLTLVASLEIISLLHVYKIGDECQIWIPGMGFVSYLIKLLKINATYLILWHLKTATASIIKHLWA